MAHAVFPSWQEDQKLKVTFGYVADSRLQGIHETLSKNQKKDFIFYC